jgi:hypothetical protein
MIVKLDNLGAAGFIPDLPAHDLPEDPLAWSSVRNMNFRANLCERVEGYDSGFDTTPTEISYGLFAATQAGGTPYIVGCADAKVYSYTGTTETDITGAVTVAATADTKWTGAQLSGLLVLNETVNAPVYIAVSGLGSGTLAALSNWPASTLCKSLRAYKYQLVAMNMTESSTAYPYKVRWSNSAVPGALPTSWVAATTNDAGSVDLSEGDGAIIDGIPFGDQFAIFRESGIWLMRYVGGTAIHVFNKVPNAIGGLLGNNCVTNVPGIGLVAMSSTDIYIFDGSATTSILDKRMQRWYANNISQSNGKRSFVVYNAKRKEVWCCFPTTSATACDAAIIWNHVENTLGYRDLPNCTAGVHAVVDESATTTYDTLAGTMDALSGTTDGLDARSIGSKTVLASTANNLYVVGNAVDAAGTGMVGQLERTSISLGDAQRVKYIRGIWPRFDATAGQQFEITVGAQMSVDEAVSWATPVTYTYGTSRFVPVNKSGRFLSLRIRNSSGASWRLKSVDADIEPRGLW